MDMKTNNRFHIHKKGVICENGSAEARVYFKFHCFLS